MGDLAELGIDLGQVEGDGDFAPVPEGDYDAEVKAAELRPTKSGGKQLVLQWSVTGPSHTGRVIFDGLNIRNPSAKAQEIGLQQMKNRQVACGLPPVIKDSSEFVGRAAKIRVKIEKSEGYEPKNAVKSASPLAGAVPLTSTRQPAAQPTAPAGSAPPWAAK